jgi:Protein of unknown function (DUF4236)
MPFVSRGHPWHMRFWHPFNVIPGVHVIAHKTGFSWEFGPRHIHFTVGVTQARFSVGLPGTGLSWYKPWDLSRPRRLAGCLPPGLGCAVPLLGVAFALATWGTDLRFWDVLGLTAFGLWVAWRVASAMGRRQGRPPLIDAAVPPRARRARRPASAQRGGLPMLPPAPRTPGTRRRRGPTG